ncbi:disease susceptibility protein LOV1-like [Salvia divinorum]|uniref:Disease susceptibility protein LOV1-like n=1 Tax=Salvia divinorum TaxID=28513 RepID=A0ABD1H6R6_SALDI
MAGHGISFKCPAAGAFPPNLSQLTLSNVKDVSMEELGKLPKLQYLTLKHSYVSENMGRMKISHGGYPCLKALSLKRMDHLTVIDMEEGGMSRLKQLRIRHCTDLKNTENLPKHIIVSFV